MLCSGGLVDQDVHHDSGFSLMVSCIVRSGALRDMLNTRAVVLIPTEKMSTSISDHGVQLGVLSHGRDPWRDCVEVLFLGISRKCNDKYSCCLPKIPCIGHANGVSFPGDTDPN